MDAERLDPGRRGRRRAAAGLPRQPRARSSAVREAARSRRPSGASREERPPRLPRRPPAAASELDELARRAPRGRRSRSCSSAARSTSPSTGWARRRGAPEAVRAGRHSSSGAPARRGRLVDEHNRRSQPRGVRGRLARTTVERSEEGRAVRVGEKEISEQAEIVRRYADLFSREQLEALREAEEARRGRRARAALPAAQDLRGRASSTPSSSSARTSSRTGCSRRGVTFRGRGDAAADGAGAARGAPGLRATARSSARSRPRRARRFNARPARAARGRRGARGRALGRSPTPVERNEEEKGISLRELSRALEARRATTSTAAYGALRDRWFERLLGPERAEVPSSYHIAYMRRLSPLEATYTKERATEVCLATLASSASTCSATEHQARPRRPAAEVAARLRDRERPAEVVHLITRAQGGLHDYQAFLHEAGHALHYGGVRPALPYDVPPHLARPRADRDLLVHRRGDLARAGVACAATSACRTSRRPRTPRRPSSSRRCSSAATRRSSASSSTSGRASPTTAARRDGYEECLTAATGIRYRARSYLSDMDAGFYSADYLRAWIRSAQLRRHLIARSARTGGATRDGRAPARALPRGHEALERGDRRPDRLRPARHGAAPRRADGA